MRAGLAIHVKQEAWKNAAINCSNLSQLELTLGQIEGDGPVAALRDEDCSG